MAQFDRARFDHIGVVTEEVQPAESWVEATRVWVTSPRAHPYNVEFLRFEPDSPVTGPLRTEPHIAYRVDDLRRTIEGHEVVLEPFDASGTGFCEVAFVTGDSRRSSPTPPRSSTTPSRRRSSTFSSASSKTGSRTPRSTTRGRRWPCATRSTSRRRRGDSR